MVEFLNGRTVKSTGDNFVEGPKMFDRIQIIF